MNRRLHVAVVVAALACFGTTAGMAQESSEASFVPLQGAWTVRAAEQRGQPFDAIVGGLLRIEGSSFALRTATGNELNGVLRLDAAASPMQIDFVLSDGAVWEGIYAASGDVLRLNYVEADDGIERPNVFATTADTPGTVIVLGRDR